MKKFFLLIFTIVLILSCGNNSGLKETQSDKMTEQEKTKFEKIRNMSLEDMEILGLLSDFQLLDDNIFFEYERRYDMFFRITRGQKEEFFVPSEINIRELVEKYPVVSIEKKYLETKQTLKNEIQKNSVFKEFETPMNKYFEYAEKKISKIKEIENYYKNFEYKKDNFQKGRILDNEYEQIKMSYDSSKIDSVPQNLNLLKLKYALNDLKQTGQTAAYKIYRIKFIVFLINAKLDNVYLENKVNNDLINQLEILGKDFKLAVSEAEKVKNSEIENEQMDIEKYTTFVKESKTQVTNFYKDLKKLKSNNLDLNNYESLFDSSKYENLQFYTDNEKNNKMGIFYK